ncbi:tyrosinase family oxidase copper chaperone [Streptomyces sp. TG1A-8]|uniref:tyrosinase family oxidase copper chaperone n=1 Tax=Streptomyces sp. TG1A-8 TaxID=3051385 RepID=UPI00265C1F6F|nr:tyrosinase family oxidase copper chaperone [Streptomyces sp. TG1A-8]MDO0927653.1 tyrosinase family oxidase copper chaperone [Streptomyces sp. TG1A-8]
MVVGVGAVATGAERGARAGAAGPSRRETARGLLASAAALVLAPPVTASRPAPPAAGPGSGVFDETYRGRRIRGVPVPAAGRGSGAGWQVTVDGRLLHLMRRADGTWLSMVDHYDAYRTPLEAARAAVDEMGPGRRLRDPAPGPAGHARTAHHRGGPHGVRA